jgi:alpha-ribazole phosphatase
MEIYLIRHTPVGIEEGTCYGYSDVALSTTFDLDHPLVKERLGEETAKGPFFSSPSQRCIILANKLCSSEVVIDERLRELNFGDWELKKWDSIDQDQMNKWMNDFVSEPCPGGESYLHLYARATDFYEELKKKNMHTAVVVTHAGIIRSILASILEIPLRKSFSLKLDCGRISKVSVNGSIDQVNFINR